MTQAADAVSSLAALAQDGRLAIFRMLVQAGEAGLAAGEIAARLDVPPSSLSFHLAHLTRAGLTRERREGRHRFYSADYTAMTRLIDYLTENCCGGEACGQATPSIAIEEQAA